MILISYVKPNVIVNSSESLTGEVEIYDNINRKIVNKTFYNEYFFSINVEPVSGREIRVVVKANKEVFKKSIQI